MKDDITEYSHLPFRLLCDWSGGRTVAEASPHNSYNSSSDGSSDDSLSMLNMSLSQYDIHGRKLSPQRREADAARELNALKERELHLELVFVKMDLVYRGKAAKSIVEKLIVPPVYMRDFGKSVNGSSPLFRTDKQAQNLSSQSHLLKYAMKKKLRKMICWKPNRNLAQ